jgi:hypothetical protein
MPWITVGVPIASKIIGGIIGSKSASKAARAAEQAKQEAMALNKGVYDQAQANQQPYQQAGARGLAALVEQADQNATGPTPAQVMAEPGYQFGLERGRDAVETSAAARGGLYSGANLEALQKFGTDYASTKYDQAYNRQRTDRNDATARYGALTGFGQRANDAVQGAGDSYAGRSTNIITGNGAAQGNAQIAKGNAWQNAINGIASDITGSAGGFMKKSSVNAPGANEMDGYGYTPAQRYADGGQVRPEPKVGTRSPLPSSGAEPMSAEALAQAVAAEKARAAEAGKKPNPVLLQVPDRLNRKSTLQRQMEAAGLADGGRVPGNGGPRADDVPIMASSGEHVLDVRTVKSLGGGNLQRGNNLLTRLRMQARGA